MKIPGIVYSLLLAVGAYVIEYFTEGQGAGTPWAPILVAAVPIILKTFTVQIETEQTRTNTRSLGPAEEAPPQKTKLQEWMLG